jgi:hypothetical protein
VLHLQLRLFIFVLRRQRNQKQLPWLQWRV